MKRELLTGNGAAAWGARLAEVDYVPAFPITPQTEIVEYVETKAAAVEHVELVETWADDVAGFVLDNELAAAVHVTVQKVDIFDSAEGVGVSIERRRAPRPDPWSSS